MKTILTKLLFAGNIGLLMLASCKKDGALVTTNGGKPGALTSTETTLVLSKARVNDTTAAIRFNITAPNYGYSAAVTNTLQIDAMGDNFAKPISVTLPGKVLSQGYSTSDFNALLLKLSLSGGVTSKVQVRVQHSVGASLAPVFSNVLTLTVTPFNLTSWLYVVGQFNGYSTATADSIFSATSNGIYTGIINFPTGSNRFLVLPARNYDNKYATTASPNTASASLTYSTEYVTGGGSDLYAPAAGGNYLITLNINTNTITVEPADSYSVIGDAALGWGTDIAMKYINDGTGNWVVTTQLVSTGAFKIRQDNAWSFSWGVPKSGSVGFGVTNTLNDVNNSNDNISITNSGNYTVTFNAPLSPLGSTPPVTTIYKLLKN